MRCVELQDRLSDLEEGALDAAGTSAALAHLDACPECARMRAALSETLDDLSEIARVEPPDGISERIVAKVRFMLPPARASRSLRFRRAAAWGAIAVGLSWQAFGGALAAHAMNRVAPILAEARQQVARSQASGEGLLAGLDDPGRLPDVLRPAGVIRSSRSSR